MQPVELRKNLLNVAARLERYVLSDEEVPDMELEEYYSREYMSHKSDVAFLIEQARKLADGLKWYETV